MPQEAVIGRAWVQRGMLVLLLVVTCQPCF